MFFSALTLALVTSSTFDSAETIKRKTVFYESQAIGQYARVKALKASAKHSLENACRKALTLPAQQKINQHLSTKVGFEIPDSLSFIDAKILGYKQGKQQGWLNCYGDVKPAEMHINEAGLALRAAWFFSKKGEQERSKIRPLITISIKHPSTVADSVALVADQSPPDKSLEYLDKYLDISSMILDQAKISVAKTWLKHKRFEQVITLTNSCESVECKRIGLAAKTAYEQLTADDLNSYF